MSIYLHPEFVIRCSHKDCEKTIILDRRSAREERKGENTWDLVAEYLTAAGWSFSRNEGYVCSETCSEHKTPWIPVPDKGQRLNVDERFYHVISQHAWGELSRGMDLVPYREHTQPRQVYAVDRYDLPTLGTWSGWTDEHSFLRDDSPLYPL